MPHPPSWSHCWFTLPIQCGLGLYVSGAAINEDSSSSSWSCANSAWSWKCWIPYGLFRLRKYGIDWYEEIAVPTSWMPTLAAQSSNLCASSVKKHHVIYCLLLIKKTAFQQCTDIENIITVIFMDGQNRLTLAMHKWRSPSPCDKSRKRPLGCLINHWPQWSTEEHIYGPFSPRHPDFITTCW